jgi:hypothetical protein
MNISNDPNPPIDMTSPHVAAQDGTRDSSKPFIEDTAIFAHPDTI